MDVVVKMAIMESQNKITKRDLPQNMTILWGVSSVGRAEGF